MATSLLYGGSAVTLEVFGLALFKGLGCADACVLCGRTPAMTTGKKQEGEGNRGWKGPAPNGAHKDEGLGITTKVHSGPCRLSAVPRSKSCLDSSPRYQAHGSHQRPGNLAAGT